MNHAGLLEESVVTITFKRSVTVADFGSRVKDGCARSYRLTLSGLKNKLLPVGGGQRCPLALLLEGGFEVTQVLHPGGKGEGSGDGG